MLAKAGQTSGHNGLTFFEVALEWRQHRLKKIEISSSKFDLFKFHGKRRALLLVFYILQIIHNLFSYLDLDPGINKPY